MNSLQTRQQTIRTIFPVKPPFHTRAQLLSGYKPIEKLPETRTQILSQKANVVYLATAEEGMTVLQAVEDANARGVTLLSHKDIDERLNGEGELWKAEKEFYPCWTGTLIIYAAPNQKFGKEISFGGLRVKIPRKWQRKKNCAIACNHPNFTLGKDGTITLKNAALIENFSQGNGWHLPEAEFGIPCGKPSNAKNPNARKLWRNNGAFVGFASAGVDLIDGGRGVVVGNRSDCRFGVLAYAKQQPQEEIQK